MPNDNHTNNRNNCNRLPPPQQPAAKDMNLVVTHSQYTRTNLKHITSHTNNDTLTTRNATRP